jgi:DNA-binding IclR family transcriptional regulator
LTKFLRFDNYSKYESRIPYMEYISLMSSAKDTVEIISFLVRSKGPQKLTDVGKALNISNSTVHRILSSLKGTEWVTQESVTKRYKVGTRFLEVALSLTSQIDLKDVSLPLLRSLHSEVNESVMLSARIGLERIYVEQMRSDYELQPIVEIGKRYPLWLGASGKAILAYLEEEERETVIARAKESGPAFSASGQAINFDKLRQELTRVRALGFSLSRGERIPGTNSVAAPIFSRDHRVVGSISLGGPAVRFTFELARRYGPRVKEIAERISLQLVAQPYSSMA